MWFRRCLFFYLIGASVAVFAQNTPNIKISVLTCEPGTQLYSSYGHTAIRVVTPKEDVVYNYGTFDFKQKNFYFNFVQGNLIYRLSKSNFSSFYRFYQYYGRSITEQKLSLSQPQAKKIYAFLQNNYLPENRNYRYDFVYDNCATRVRDVISSIDSLDWHLSTIQDVPKRSIRAWLNDYVVNKIPDMDLLLGLLLGSRTDQIASRKVEMFLPDRLKNALMVATHTGQKPLIKETLNYHFTPKVWPPKMSYYFIASLILICSMVGLVKASFREKRTLIFDRIFALGLGILGVIIFYLNFLSNHSMLFFNWHLIWIAPWWLFFWHFKPKWNNFFLIMGLLYVGAPFIFPFFPQDMHLISYLLCTAFGFRLLDRWWRNKAARAKN